MRVHDDTENRRTLLVVDDDVELRSMLTEVLETEGYEVAGAGNGAEALQYLREAPPPDLILLDLCMPVKDGWQFRVEQKADPLLALIPVMVMSGDPSSQAAAIDAAVFLEKPVRAPRLLASIRDIISSIGAASDVAVNEVYGPGFALSTDQCWTDAADEAVTDRMAAPFAQILESCTRANSIVLHAGRSYRLTEIAAGEFVIERCCDGVEIGAFAGSPASMWRVFAEETNVTLVRAIIVAAIEMGLIPPTPG
jgi:CheY-like chemotaxis protein